MRKCDSLFRIVPLLLVAVIPALGLAQDGELKPVTNKYAIKNATIVQAPGRTIQNGAILIENGIIKAVGSSIAIPPDAWIVDADSMFVYAGFISGLSNIGIEKPKEEKKDLDDKLTGTPPNDFAGITPDRSAQTMLSSSEKSVEDFRQLGFTAAHTVPHGKMLPGTGAIVLLSKDNMLVKGDVSMFAQLEGADGVYPNTVIGVMAKYRDLYRKADQARSYASRYNSNPLGMERPAKDATLEAFYPVISKQQPVMFKTESIKDIMRAKALQKDLGFTIMFGEVKQGWDAIPTLKSLGVPVFLSLDLPEWKDEEKVNKDEKDVDNEEKVDGDEEKSDEEEDEDGKDAEDNLEEKMLKDRQLEIIRKYYAQASMFSKNGIPYGFSTMEVNAKDFKTNLLKVIESGLTEDEALRALTTSPANILGLSGTMGTLEVGKMANLFISDTAYFTKDANVRFVFVDGVKFEYKVKEKKKKNGGEPVEAAGIWSYTSETPQGKGEGKISIKGTAGNYSGTMTLNFNNSTNEMEDISVDGNTVSFTIKTNVGQEITIEVTMTIDGETFEGTISVDEFGSFPLEGSKEPEK